MPVYLLPGIKLGKLHAVLWTYSIFIKPLWLALILPLLVGHLLAQDLTANSVEVEFGIPALSYIPSLCCLSLIVFSKVK